VKVVPAGPKRKPVWRVQLTGMTEQQAHAACASSKHHAGCMMIRPNPQLASR
jgi:hypothetical protein